MCLLLWSSVSQSSAGSLASTPPTDPAIDPFVVEWASSIPALQAFDAWAREYQAREPLPVRPDGPIFPGDKQCPSSTLSDTIHLTAAGGMAPRCAQVCLFSPSTRSFVERGGLTNQTCEQHGCTTYLGERWASNVLYYTYVCELARPTVPAECLREGLEDGAYVLTETRDCMHALSLLYEWQHAHHPELGPALARGGPRAGERMPWHEALALATACVAAAVAIVALLAILRLLGRRPELVHSESEAGKLEPLGGGSIRRIDVFRGLRVREIRESLPGAQRKVVVTTDGAVYDWSAGAGSDATSLGGWAETPAPVTPALKLLGPGSSSRDGRARPGPGTR
jgi:hypothetical protein